MEKFLKTLKNQLLLPGISLAKTALKSGRPSKGCPSPRHKALIIMGNGPSLRSFIEDKSIPIELFDLLAVNFAAITPEFFQLRPSLYVLADPHFFNPATTDPKVTTLWENLRRSDWPITLWLPLNQKKSAGRLLENLPANIRISWMNLTPVDGEGMLARFLIDKGLGMPRPRNVLIPSIMVALREGYRKIYIVGADHSWSQSLRVDDHNRVVSVQPHFYKDNKEELERVSREYEGYHLHDILNSLTIAFRSYFSIRDYASFIGAEIINATPESFIDAFPRCDYAQMKPLSTP